MGQPTKGTSKNINNKHEKIMALICSCPAATSIPDVANVACEESFGQIQKAAFCRLNSAAGTPNKFTSTASILLKASWSTKLAATDGTKIVVTPYIYAPADSGGEPRVSSGGNDDLGGIPMVLGEQPIQFQGQLRGIPQAVATALKELACEANAGNLGVFLFDENGRIECIAGSTTGDYLPIPIRGFYVGSKLHGNYDAKDYNLLQWNYAENYSNGLVIVTPTDFNPLTDLTNASNT